MLRQTEKRLPQFLCAGELAIFFCFLETLQIITYSSITEIVDCGTSSNQAEQVTDE